MTHSLVIIFISLSMLIGFALGYIVGRQQGWFLGWTYAVKKNEEQKTVPVMGYVPAATEKAHANWDDWQTGPLENIEYKNLNICILKKIVKNEKDYIFYYVIVQERGTQRYNTLWHMDKACNSREECITLAEHWIDNEFQPGIS
jgi:hypothetical protein